MRDKKESMKRLLSIAALLLCVYFCAIAQAIPVWVRDVKISVSEADNTKGAIIVQIRNSSSKRLCYGDYYRLEVFVENQWVEVKASLMWNDLLYIVDEGESITHDFPVHIHLDSGLYRFTFFFRDYDDGEKFIEHSVTYEFEI